MVMGTEYVMRQEAVQVYSIRLNFFWAYYRYFSYEIEVDGFKMSVAEKISFALGLLLHVCGSIKKITSITKFFSE